EPQQLRIVDLRLPRRARAIENPRALARGSSANPSSADQMADWIQSASCFFGRPPSLVAATWPSLNTIRVGMPRTPYFFGVAGLWSMLILTIFTLPSSCWPISSSAGAIALQGPHHSAQKSTSTGPEAFRTSASNEVSLTWVVLMLIPSYPWIDRRDYRSVSLRNLWTPPALVKPRVRSLGASTRGSP